MSRRGVVQTLGGKPTMDDAVVRLTWTIGIVALDHVDLFLLPDEFRSDSPDYPLT